MPKNYTRFCSECGLKMQLKQLNEEKAVYICADKRCDYNSTRSKWLITNRINAEMESKKLKKLSTKRTKKRERSAALTDIEEMVDLTYSNTCENAVYITPEHSYPKSADDTLQCVGYSLPTDEFNIDGINCARVPDSTNKLLEDNQLKIQLDVFHMLGCEYPEEINRNSTEDVNSGTNNTSEACTNVNSKFDGFKFTSYVIKSACNTEINQHVTEMI